jgi:hypothetical protein
VTLRIKGSNAELTPESFIPGQTYATPDGRVKGTVYDWDSREKILMIAVKVGLLEGGDPITQHY